MIVYLFDTFLLVDQRTISKSILVKALVFVVTLTLNTVHVELHFLNAMSFFCIWTNPYCKVLRWDGRFSPTYYTKLVLKYQVQKLLEYRGCLVPRTSVCGNNKIDVIFSLVGCSLSAD